MTDDASEDRETDGETPPVACTLSEAEYERRKPWMERAFLPLLASVEDVESGVEMTFEGADETVETVARFVNEESDCCSFARFEVAVEPPYDRTTLTITGPEGTADLFRAGFFEALDELPGSLEGLPDWFDDRHVPG